LDVSIKVSQKKVLYSFSDLDKNKDLENSKEFENDETVILVKLELYKIVKNQFEREEREQKV